MAEKNDTNGQKRKTLTLNLNNTSRVSSSGSRKNSLEIEIKKKRGSLRINEPAKENGFDVFKKKDEYSGQLTQEEINARLNVLKNIKQEDKDTELEEHRAEYEEQVSTEPIQEALPETNETEKKQEEIKPSKPKIVYPKKPAYVAQSEPVVFRVAEYDKKPQKQVKPQKPTVQEKQRTIERKVSPASVKRTIDESQVPQKVTQQPVRKFKPKDIEDSEQKKKKGVTVRSSMSDRRNKTNGRVTRAFLDMAMNDETGERTRSLAAVKRARQKQKDSIAEKEVAKVIRDVDIPDTITVGELANRMAVRSAEVIKYLMSTGTMATINQLIDGDTAEIVCSEFGHKPRRITDAFAELDFENIQDDPADLEPRAPIVAVMGHVDHGKTTLLDTLRKTSVAQKEAGGITQHVAAYQIETETGKKITFIDTPGHAAFSNIRARGACITDIIVLVVAADDGIKEQTVEVIKQARSQNVPLVVAINKIDKPDINIDRIKTELMNHEVVLECFGGETLSAEISAKQNININGLIETILLQAEVLELKANKKRAAVGTVLESRVDKGKGIIASVIIQHGTLNPGDVIVAGQSPGKVRTIYDDAGNKIKFAEPAMPVEVSGFNKTPEPGDVLAVVDSEQKAREIAEYRETKAKAKANKAKQQSIEQMISKEDGKTLNLIIKADVHGSLEAIVATLEAIQHPEISVKVVDKGVGIVSENDIDFAKTANAIVVGFNVNVSADARDAAKINGIQILKHSIIYHMTEEIKGILGTMLSPIIEENYIGTADVRKIFTISRIGTIAGCYVTDGIVKRNDSKIKVVRNKKVIFEGKIRSMRHEKDEIKESRQGHECGIFAEGYNDFLVGDQIECYEIISKARTVD